MESWIFILIMTAVYLLLQIYILPRMGVST